MDPDAYSDDQKDEYAWGKSYNGYTVYVLKSGSSYSGFYRGYWYALKRTEKNGTITYTFAGSTKLYYKYTLGITIANTPTATPTAAPNSEPQVPAGYVRLDRCWGVEYNGKKVYICYVPGTITNPGGIDPGVEVMGYVEDNNEWIKLSVSRVALDCRYLEQYSIVYYQETWDDTDESKYFP